MGPACAMVIFGEPKTGRYFAMRPQSRAGHPPERSPQNASFIPHAHPAMCMRGGREQNHGQEPRGDSSYHHCH